MLRLALFAGTVLLLSLLLAYSAFDTPAKVSPQGCRMSYMSPSYVLQTGFNASWTSPSLALRYRLMLYREVGWDPQNELRGVPVLFIPGNAGSAHQVRSIASSASRQYYISPSRINAFFASRNLRPLDVFAVDFNEDLSAFHGPILASQRQYSADAITYILSLYPPNTQIIILGHSMGGIVATALLPASEIAAIITMSTPHGVPPARFDSRMDAIYSEVQMRLTDDPTPILSLCGGITDTMIPSEFCVLPPAATKASGYRKTVFTSSLEGCWSGVGHREMVWCHQVRWRVARAVLELAGSRTKDDIAQILDNWFRDGIKLSKLELRSSVSAVQEPATVSAETLPLTVKNPRGAMSYKLAIPNDQQGNRSHNVVVYLSKGSILSVSPADPLPLQMSIRLCREGVARDSDSIDHPVPDCELIRPSALRLIPNPDPEQLFPAPHEGVDESDGVVVFSAPLRSSSEFVEWIQLDIQSDATRGWFVATAEPLHKFTNYASPFGLLFRDINIRLNPSTLKADIRFPNLLSNVLIVYRARTTLSGSCKGSLLPPLLLHTSGLHEAHYHPISDKNALFLHGHSSAPFLSLPSQLREDYSRGVNLSVFSSGECGIESLSIGIDWWNSFGRWVARYWNAIVTWGSGLVCFLSYSSWSDWDAGAPMPTPTQSFALLIRLLPRAMALFTAVSILPLPGALWLGNNGEPMFALLAPFVLVLSCGLVILSWLVLVSLLVPYGKLVSLASRIRDEDSKERPTSVRIGLLTVLLMSLLVFLLIPWQVAFLACYLIHLHHCAGLLQEPGENQALMNVRNQKLLILLAMTWCLPVVAPVLAVWVRTLATAGLTTPFNGDHFVLNTISFAALTFTMVTTRGPLFARRQKWEAIPVPYLYALGALVTFVVGPRATYRMYEALNWPTFALLCFRVVPQYLRIETHAAYVADVR